MLQINSPTAAEYEGQGHRFDADLHFIECSRDAWTMRWLSALIKKYEAFIAAHFMAEDSVTVSVELEFSKDQDGREAMRQCQKQYVKGPPKRPKIGYDDARRHRRLYNGRFYKLPDGRAFLLFGKWDHHGNRVGKVQVGPRSSRRKCYGDAH